ncbi:hypothetical protein G6F46_011677 [Rhizopus delemar]|nr:hypothetical protein G6F48_012060 [Rhizopus delemar]KAG1608268.1 hypothetical protein G6F46_011677 [Rhizopus delemar]
MTRTFSSLSILYFLIFILPQMTRTISKSVQNQIQLLLASNMAYEQVMERISGLKKSTLGRCTNKFFPNRMKAAPGRRATIGETT